MVLEACKYKIKVQADLVSGRPSSWLIDSWLFTVTSPGRRTKEPSRASSVRGTSPLLITLSPPKTSPPNAITLGGLALQHRKFGGWTHDYSAQSTGPAQITWQHYRSSLCLPLPFPKEGLFLHLAWASVQLSKSLTSCL